MKKLLENIQISVNDHIYLKDPFSSKLGIGILNSSLELIDDIGLESFTFKKLAQKLGSTESSIYRYFESKQRLLNYYTYWYWAFLEYYLALATTNLKDPEERLKKTLSVVICGGGDMPNQVSGLNLELLKKVLISELSKSYLIKEVDEIKKEGFFKSFADFVERMSDIILEIDPQYKYPHALCTTVIEGIYHQRFFALHLPSLTDFGASDKKVLEFYFDMCNAVLNIDIKK